MTLNFLDLYNECAGQPWSMFDADAEDIEDLESALKISINKATSFLWNYQPWSFRYATQMFKTRVNKNKYPTPDGILIRKVTSNNVSYGIKCNGKNLTFIENPDSLELKQGEPDSFYILGEDICLYPTPDNVYTISLDYLLLPYGLDSNDESIYELSEQDDRVNVPEKYETVFKNCLISLAMMYAIADESDENYSGYKKQYDDSLNVLMKYCVDKLQNKRITW